VGERWECGDEGAQNPRWNRFGSAHAETLESGKCWWLLGKAKSSGTASTMTTVILAFTGIRLREEWVYVGVHEVGESVDENNADATGEVYGLQFPALAAARYILRVLTRILCHKTPPTQRLAATP